MVQLQVYERLKTDLTRTRRLGACTPRHSRDIYLTLTSLALLRHKGGGVPRRIRGPTRERERERERERPMHICCLSGGRRGDGGLGGRSTQSEATRDLGRLRRAARHHLQTQDRAVLITHSRAKSSFFRTSARLCFPTRHFFVLDTLTVTQALGRRLRTPERLARVPGHEYSASTVSFMRRALWHTTKYQRSRFHKGLQTLYPLSLSLSQPLLECVKIHVGIPRLERFGRRLGVMRRSHGPHRVRWTQYSDECDASLPVSEFNGIVGPGVDGARLAGRVSAAATGLFLETRVSGIF